MSTGLQLKDETNFGFARGANVRLIQERCSSVLYHWMCVAIFAEARDSVRNSGAPSYIIASLWLIAPIIIAVRLNFDVPLGYWLTHKDFVNLWVAGRLAGAGEIATIFDPPAFQHATSVLLAGTWTTNNYSYPPHALFIALPFGLLPYFVAFLAWTALGVILFTWAAKRTCPAWLPWWAAALSPAGLINIAWGHYGFFYGALWLWAFRCPRGGVFAGLLTFKPHLGLLVVPRLDRRQLVIACCVTALLVVLSVAAFGMAAWTAFFKETLAFQAHLLAPENRSKLTFLQTSPVITYGWAGWLIFAVAGAYLVSRKFNVFTAATATFLITPYAFHYDMTVATLGFALLLHRPRVPPLHRLAASLGFLCPALVLLAGNWLASPVLLAGLYVQTRHSADA